MSGTNEITGDALVSKAASDAYRSNWDLIFGKKAEVNPAKFLIIANKGYCAVCKEELRSYNRHDYKTCSCRASAVDGGTTYQRCTGSLVDTSIVLEDSPDNLLEQHELIREYFCWGSYGKKGDQPLKYLILKDMQTEHIYAILETQKHVQGAAKAIFQNELYYRSNQNALCA